MFKMEKATMPIHTRGMAQMTATATIGVLLVLSAALVDGNDNGPFKWIDRVQTECEAVSMGIATTLADAYNSFDENTEWDVRIHHDYLTKYMGFATWITSGVWHSGGRTSTGNDATQLQRVICALHRI
jgi:hypothetical protein